MNIKKIAYIVVGCIGVGLGAVGAVVPMLPAFPFLLLAAFCFGRSSEKLNNWFISTKLYKNNLCMVVPYSLLYIRGKDLEYRSCRIINYTNIRKKELTKPINCIMLRMKVR